MLNWKEVHKILDEVPLEGSFIQKVIEHDVHSFTFSLFNQVEKAFLFYVSVGTKDSLIMSTSRIREKGKTTQRFGQYLKSHMVGKRISSVEKLPFDRAFILHLTSQDEKLDMLFRLYSGSGANIIVLDENGKILELMYRRPKRGEMPGDTIRLERRESEGEKHYETRLYDTPTLSEFLDKEESIAKRSESLSEYKEKIERKRNREIGEIKILIKSLEKRIENSTGFEEDKKIGDLLSANMHILRKGMTTITLTDWESGQDRVIELSAKDDPGANIQNYYERYRKNKRSWEIASDELVDAKERLSERENHYEKLLSLGEEDIKKLRKEAESESEEKKDNGEKKIGIHLTSQGFSIIVGRNSKENDQILRHYTRGSDVWMHTRDFPGGYVIIKSKKGKTIPLPVLLDGANLAIHFSKGKQSGKADLYYTEVKYLRRAKDGKEGLVLPTQEKNLTVTLDERRVNSLLGRREDENIK